MNATNKPEYGKLYSLTGKGKSIANGNTWEESLVEDPSPPTPPRINTMGGWSIDYDLGRLEHPCGYLTSWMAYREGQWVITEWAIAVNPVESSDLMTAINENYVEAV
jgi:hypothetical protein